MCILSQQSLMYNLFRSRGKLLQLAQTSVIWVRGAHNIPESIIREFSRQHTRQHATGEKRKLLHSNLGKSFARKHIWESARRKLKGKTSAILLETATVFPASVLASTKVCQLNSNAASWRLCGRSTVSATTTSGTSQRYLTCLASVSRLPSKKSLCRQGGIC